MRHREDAAATESAWTDFEALEMEGTRMGIISSVHGRALTAMDNDQTWDATLSKQIPGELGARLVIGDKVLLKLQHYRFYWLLPRKEHHPLNLRRKALL